MSTNRDDRDLTRRALIKWSLAAGAALGVTRSRILEVLEGSAGRGVAEAAAATTGKRSVHIRAGTGGFAWFQLLWPHNAIAAANNPNFAWHRPNQSQLVQGTTKPLTIGPDTPFSTLPGSRQISAFMAGTNEAHINNPNSIVRSLNGNSLFAIAAVLQANNPTVVPVIAVDDVDLGTAPGAPRAAVVPTGNDIVGLFNSAASRAGGLLATSSHADLYRAQYATLAALNRASDRPTTRGAYTTARSAAHFLGTNLADKLQITPMDEARYGIDANMRPDLAAIGRTLIVAVKAFAMGLTSSILLPGLRDDPHQAFADMASLGATVAGWKLVLDGFMTDLTNTIDTVTKVPLADDIVITIEGDTPKTPLERLNWGDNPPGDCNWVYVLGGGKLKTGWFGGIDASGKVTGFDPASGDPAGYDGNRQAQAACAAVAYAIANGDLRAVQDFSRMDISGIIV